jgi:uncharacterized lipoprotein YbaY
MSLAVTYGLMDPSMSEQTPESLILQGQIELPHQITAFRPARVVIELEDISRADAPSQIAARLHLETGTLRSGDTIPFAIEIPAGALDEQSLYSVRVHIDVNGSGIVDPGDYITMQSYPVLTRGYGNKVRVAVRQV